MAVDILVARCTDGRCTPRWLCSCRSHEQHADAAPPSRRPAGAETMPLQYPANAAVAWSSRYRLRCRGSGGPRVASWTASIGVRLAIASPTRSTGTPRPLSARSG